ncbi:hypothetical protein JST97_19985 [bacterium]|nr:hypothetical protein [bacterium]
MISIGPRPGSLAEAQDYVKLQAKYRPRVQKLIDSVEVYKTAIGAQDQSERDLHDQPGVVILVGARRAELGLYAGNTGSWPPAPHPGCDKRVETIDAMLDSQSTQKLELEEKGPGGRKILWIENTQGFESVYQVQDQQGTLKFGRRGETITILSDQPN